MGKFQLQIDKAAAYEAIHSSLSGLTSGELVWEAALVSLIALLKEHLPWLSWVGLYRNANGNLWVGPYQGKLACIYLKPGQGVCGTSLVTQKPIIVEDVHAFEGHVFCDPLARSEIVLPVYRTRGQTRELIGVLDLDSHSPAAFDTSDQKNLEELLTHIERLPDPS